MPQEPEIGQVLDGKYRLDARIGQGGMGTVYRAVHLTLKAPRAIKVMRRELAEDEGFVARFEAEARLAEGFRHPNLVAVYDLGRLPEGAPYIVSELVEGETVASLLRARRSFPPEEVALFLGQIARGLAVAHEKGIVHRDIAPDNIMITRYGTAGAVARLLDFGIAKDLTGSASPKTASSLLLGKLGYAAPEQMGSLAVVGAVDSRADVFALSAVAFEMLTGRLPWRKESLQSYVHDLLIRPEEEISRDCVRASAPEHWRELLCRGLSRDRERRVPDMLSLADGMDRAVGALVELSNAATVRHQRPPSPPRRGWPVALPIAAVGAVVAGLALYWGYPTPAPATHPPTPAPTVTLAAPSTPEPTPSVGGGPEAGLEPEAETVATPDKAPTATPTPRPTAPPAPVATPTASEKTPAPAPPRTSVPARGGENASPPPPGPAETPLPATLIVKSTPQAVVRLDGEIRGRTPALLNPLAPGRHEIVLTSDDGRQYSELVEVAPGESLERSIRLPGFGSLSIVSSSWAMVAVDGGPASETPVRFEKLVAGRHRITASRPGYVGQVIDVEVQEGDVQRLVIDLEKAP
jgi:serine/threonine protein kinase